jgi:arylsulfatase A-like enzyme
VKPNTSTLIAAFVLACTLPLAAEAKPNILVFLADDLGYGELGVQGYTQDIPTPHIDSIAKNGVRFTQGYVSCPFCAPTRAGLMTGRYQQRSGFETNPGAGTGEANFGLARSETTLAERLKSFGLATGMVGKWHLGFKPEMQPPARGFDEFFGFLHGAHLYLPGQGRGNLMRGTQGIEEPEYLTDAFAREAVAFITKHKAEPWFLYLPFNAVHSPLQAAKKYEDRFAHIADPKRRTFAGMTSAMDDAVGRVLATLRAHGLEERTLIFFFSDNGGPTAQTTSGNGPLRGFKVQMWEGGVRIPFLMQWKGRLPAGSIYEHPVTALDIHPTAVAAIGETVLPAWKLDGVNLLPFLTGENRGKPHETLYWRAMEKHAIRHGDWKLVVGERDTPRPALFNLATDLGEKNDLATKEPAKLAELTALWEAWSKQMQAPLWQRVNTPAKGKSSPAAGSVKGLEARFNALDKDHDGKLNAEEQAQSPQLKGADKNGDGFITLEEVRAHLGSRRSKSAPKTAPEPKP